jgi:ferritin-like metal-binding protein YciE
VKLDTLAKLQQDQMAALHHGEEQFLDFVPQLVGVATHFDLRSWIRDIMPHTRERIGRIEQVMPANPITEQGKDAPGMRGLIEEGHVFLERASDPDVIDAGLVILFQRILQDLMSRYTALRTFAVLLGQPDEAAVFQRSLDELARAGEVLVHMALETINIDALSASSR